ncbi:hypothetical protein [Enterococcus hirae]|uniref:hypothetical protein n=1 Tax=Enterococcus hirae TaxID=1354 RepID=UPI0009BAEDBC|nr:hypothetical protein [Enterococcus hirae]MBE8786594.1 hypothetical protein [Enterococcus hirae]MBE8805099.1 hypothetical protein [Enterococcus hirae]MBO1087935.1 hypothetical protein [Enterococcus hirae]NBA38982.1 hypothetical protein [Enterococcus hirae]NBA55429.1 hypothetical protein [Enterococcus hirae]
MAVWQIQLRGRDAYGLISLLDVLFRKEMPDLFSLDQIIAIIGARLGQKLSQSLLVSLKTNKR